MTLLRLTVDAESYVLARVRSGTHPTMPAGGRFACVLRLGGETTVVAPRELAPVDADVQDVFRLTEVQGPFALDSTGVVAAVAGPLAAAGVSLFAFSVWDTDAFLVQEADLDRAVRALTDAGHTVRCP